MKISKSNNVSLSKRNAVYDELWLLYFNEALFKNGLITEEQRRKISVKIKTRPR